MGGKIDVYLDCVSPYSYFGFLETHRNEEVLNSYGVDVEFIPVFLGGINVGSGNKPPASLPAKAQYSPYDLKRAKKEFNVPRLNTPDFFPILSLLPQRAMVYVKEAFPKQKFEAAFQDLFIAMWEDTLDISKPELLQKTLAKRFTDQEIEAIFQATASPKYKQKLLDNTQKALDLGAFGAPWFWVRNAKGEEEPFFGSDRFHYIWDFLGIPRTRVSIIPKPKL